MAVDLTMSARAKKAKSPWRGNPMCATPRAIERFRLHARKPTTLKPPVEKTEK